jgi:hypothetical protein
MRVSAAAAVAVLAGAIHFTATADTLSIGISERAYIAGPIRGQTRGRVLLAFPLPAEVQQSRIDFVKLQFPSILIPDSNFALVVEAYPVTTVWERSTVVWNYPWRTPGGDFDSVRLARFSTATTDSHPIVLDITKAARQWQSGRSNCGLILKRPDHEGGGFSIEGLPLRQVLSSARVKFYFTRIQR